MKSAVEANRFAGLVCACVLDRTEEGMIDMMHEISSLEAQRGQRGQGSEHGVSIEQRAVSKKSRDMIKQLQ